VALGSVDRQRRWCNGLLTEEEEQRLRDGNGDAPVSPAHGEEGGELAGSGEDGGAAIALLPGERRRSDRAGLATGSWRSEQRLYAHVRGDRRTPPRPANQRVARGDRANDKQAPHVSEHTVLIKPINQFSARKK
jgi:hypothetical protein